MLSPSAFISPYRQLRRYLPPSPNASDASNSSQQLSVGSGKLGSNCLGSLLLLLALLLGDLVVGLRAHLSAGLQTLDQVVVVPPDPGGEVPESAELPVELQTEDLEGLGDDHPLLHVVGGRHSLEAPEPGESHLPPGGLVGHHSPDGSPDDLGGGSVVEGAVPGVGVRLLAKELHVLEAVTVQGSGDVDVFTSHQHNGLAVEELLCHHGGEAAEEVSSGVDDDFLLKHGGPLLTNHSMCW
mmetsp:Transcript_29410/g.57735  ORF Transcript_29410/g.57735 Transcript_29410/m.57735 type:complete len:240 (+) Transcript_29410:385-1104(+)